MWLTVQQVADLTGKTTRAIKKKCSKNKFDIKKKKHKGKYGFHFLIDLYSLPGDVQLEYSRRIEEKKKEESTGLHESPPPDNLMLYRDQMDTILKKVDIVKEAFRIQEVYKPQSTYKLEELAIKNNISLATLYRWIKLYKSNYSITSLGRGENITRGKRKKITDELIKYMKSLYIDKRQPSVAQCYRQVIEYCKENDLYTPSYQSMRKIIKEGIPPMVTSMAREGEMKWKDTYEPIIRRDFSEFPVNQLWFSDHHEFDIFVDYNGRIFRPWITANMDARSRAIVGYSIHFRPNSKAISLSLRHSILPKTHNDYPMCGIPKEIYIDNGKDYRSRLISGRIKNWGKIDFDKDTKGILQELGVKIHHAKPYYARSKIIERWFWTLEEEIRLLPGYCGKNPKGRPSKLKKELKTGKLLSFKRFLLEVEKIIVTYHNRKHRTINTKPQIEWIENIGAPVIPDERSLDILLMPSMIKRIYSDGIHFFGGRRYWDTYFVSHKLINQEIEVRYDPDDINEVLVFQNEKYLCKAYKKGAIGFNTEEELKESLNLQKRTRKKIKEVVREMEGGQIPPRLFDLEDYNRKRVKPAIKKIGKTRFDKEQEANDEDEIFVWEFEREEALQRAKTKLNKEKRCQKPPKV